LFYVTSLTFILSGSPVPPASQATSATDERRGSARVAAARASSVAGNSKNCATSSSTINEHCSHFSHFHCATSLLSLSFFQVHRVLQRCNHLHAVSVRRCALALITEHCDTSILSLSFHQVPDQPFQKRRCRHMQVRNIFAPTS
jgi:hypothetical protein